MILLLINCAKLFWNRNINTEVMVQTNGDRETPQSHTPKWFNPFPHNKILDLTKLKAFADDKLNVTKMVISVFDRVENMVGRGEIACTRNFSFSHNVFKRLLSQRRQKVSLCGNGLTTMSSSPLVVWQTFHPIPWCFLAIAFSLRVVNTWDCLAKG